MRAPTSGMHQSTRIQGTAAYCTHVLDELVGLRVMERASNARDGDIAVRLVLHIQGHLVPLSIHDVYVPQRSARTAKYSGHRYTRPKAFSSGN